MTASSEIRETTEAESEGRESPALPKRHFAKALNVTIGQHQTLKPNTSWLITFKLSGAAFRRPLERLVRRFLFRHPRALADQ